MERKTRYHGFIGLAVLLVSEALMFASVYPVTIWFYSLAWWSYIMIVDQAVYHLKGSSLWVNRRSEFLLLIPTSVFFWMIFEGLNVFLKNWYYIGIPGNLMVRWAGYFIAYATVLPALFETMELLETLGLFKKIRVPYPFKTDRWLKIFSACGFLTLLGVIFLPRLFFPFAWLAFILILEPALYTRGGISLMRQWKNGNVQKVFLLLAAGLICGLLWEFWNFWTTSKWVYTVPFFSWLKVFEMPLLGFLGFPPFAVECYVMYNFVALVRGRGEGPEKEGKTSPYLVIAGLVIFILTFVLVARSIDFYTVKLFI